MYYIPKHFDAREIFPLVILKQHMVEDWLDPRVWRLMDDRALITLDRLREKYGTTIVNDYMWGGKNKGRGYRSPLDLLDVGRLCREGQFHALWSSFTSQHCYGRAIDCKFKHVTAEQVRNDIRNNPDDPAYEHITAVEDTVSWLHFDVRSWNKRAKGILFF